MTYTIQRREKNLQYDRRNAKDRFAIRREKDVEFLILSQRIIPPIAVIIPLYLLLAKVHLIDTVLRLVVSYTTLTLPFAVWMLTSYFAEFQENRMKPRS
jgi:multiple sugar transport system permease protein